MNEKTSEEKLREELERDSLTGDNPRSPSESKSKSSRLRGVRPRVSSGTDKSIGQRVDSFIDEFEKKIEESVNIGSVKIQPKQDKPRAVRRTESEKPEVKESEAKSKAPVNFTAKPDTKQKTKSENLSLHEEHSEAKPKASVNLPTEPDTKQETKPENLSLHEEHQEHKETKQPLTVDVPNEITPPETPHEDIMPVETVNEIPQVIPEAEPVHEHEVPSQIETVNEIPQIVPEADPEILPEHEHEHEILPEPEAEHEILPELEAEHEPVIDETEDIHEESESESLPNIEPKPEPEQIEPDELPDIPLIDSEQFDEQEDELPDIPVISADEVEEPDEKEELEEFEDIPVLDAEEEEEESDESESELEPETEAESEETEDDMLEVTGDNEEPEQEDEPDETEEISSPADIVVNIDEDLPQIIDAPEREEDPEAEAVPVSVTMPESTKTAEDKLMADIAEAMTGNPLTLDSKESPEPYRLPENFFTPQNDNSVDNSQQSAEDKLKANIAQAMSESPLGIAQQQAMQNIEDDLNPFDDISLPELSQRNSAVIPESESLLESEPESESEHESESESEQNEDTEEAFLPDFTDEPENVSTDPEEIQEIPESESETEPEEENDDDDSEPFDLEDNESEQEEPEEPEENEANLDELPLSDNASDDVIDDVIDEEPVVESDTKLEVEDVPLPDPDLEPESESESEPEHLTAQQRLEQEIAQFTQNAPEESVNDNDTQNEEAEQENKMPESLLDGNENEIEPQNDDEIGDDWDINSLGIVSEAASIPDDEPEELPESEPEPEPELSLMNETEEMHKEKTMGIREKLAARKNGTSANDSSSTSKKSSSSSSSSGGGILLPLLLGLLLVVGGLTFWQLYTLPDKIASIMANFSGGNFESVSGIETTNPSYDYSIDFILDPNIVERMSQRGRDGWQVVGSRRTQDSTTGQYGYEIIFMRRIPGR